MNFTMTWLVSKISQSVLLCLFLVSILACRREDTNLDVKSTDQDYQIGGYYTDTVTVKTSTVYVADSTVSSSSYLMCGAFHDTEMGNSWAESFTQIRMTQENLDLRGAVITSTVLSLDYGYAYGDTLENQTFAVYSLPTPLVYGTTYYTITPRPDLSALTPIGTATFQARPNTVGHYIVVTLDNAFGQQVFDASNTTNDNFVNSIYGIAIVPVDHDKGAVLQIGFTDNTKLMINFNAGIYSNLQLTYSINGNSARYYTGNFDRTGTPIAGLVNSYDEVSSSSTAGQLYLQSMMGVKTKITFPYLKKLLVQDGVRVLINKAALYMPIKTGTNALLKEPTALVMLMTDENGKISHTSTGTPRLLQNDYASAIGTTSNQVIYPNTERTSYSAYLSSYFLANQLGQLAYNPLFVSPLYNSSEVNRVLLDGAGIKLKVYYSIVK